MRIALNMTTLVQGGVLQRAVSFVQHLQQNAGGFDWRLFLSPRVAQELSSAGVTPPFPCEVLGPSPARNAAQRRGIASQIDAADCDWVFTFAGPSYLRLRTPELMGVADGWVTHADRTAYRSLPSFRDRWRTWAASNYKLRWFRRSRRFVAQTETARRGLAARLPVDLQAVSVVPNAVAPWYRTHRFRRPDRRSDAPREILYFAAHYPHKRHDVLPQVASELQRLGVERFRFLTTLGEETAIARQLRARAISQHVAEHIQNLGTIPVSEGPGVYERATLCFVPSVLETFSATYIESMAAGVPLVVTDLPFAREICGPAALYFDPRSPRHAAEQVARLLGDPELQEHLVAAGRQQLALFPSPEAQITMYFEIFRSL